MNSLSARRPIASLATTPGGPNESTFLQSLGNPEDIIKGSLPKGALPMQIMQAKVELGQPSRNQKVNQSRHFPASKKTHSQTMAQQLSGPQEEAGIFRGINSSADHATAAFPSPQKTLSPRAAVLSRSRETGIDQDKGLMLAGQVRDSGEIIIEQNLIEEESAAKEGRRQEYKGSSSSRNSFVASMDSLKRRNRNLLIENDLEPMPIYGGEIRGSEPNIASEQRKSFRRMVTAKKEQLDQTRFSVSQKSSKSATKGEATRRKSVFKRPSFDSFSAPGQSSLSRKGDESDASPRPISQKDCKHLKVKQGESVCALCGLELARFGSVFDTGTVRSFIKVIYVDESRREPSSPVKFSSSRMGQNNDQTKPDENQGRNDEQPAKSENAVQDNTDQEPQLLSTIVSQDKSKLGEQEGRNLDIAELDSTLLIPTSSQDVSLQKESVYRDIRDTMAVADNDFVIMKEIYESFTPENTHQMREYMLHVILKQIKYMKKHRLIDESVQKQFRLLTDPEGALCDPLQICSELKSFLHESKKNKRLLDPEYLKFDSTLESGNLERVEAYPLNHKTVEAQRASNQLVLQKYHLFCKVDTNTKGHQQWFYFKVKNTKTMTRYSFSIRNFTKPFSLFKQGMQVHMLSKRRQADYVRSLEEEIAKHEEAGDNSEPLSEAAQRLKDKGTVEEQWERVGSKIEYFKSKLERAGWHIPGPLNLDEEEEENVEQDDLAPAQVAEDTYGIAGLATEPDHYQARQKRYFFQMNFDLEFPFEDDTCYLAYSHPYPYSKIIAHMFEAEDSLRANALNKEKEETANREDFHLKLLGQDFLYERSLLCTTICGLPVPKITMTANRPVGVRPLHMNKRKTIFVTARVHPGETNASTVFQGFFDRLIENVNQSALLANYIVRMVPCMNPDGVVCGNYRSSLAGVDLNRQWILPSKDLHPEVYHTKALMSHITKEGDKKILIYCDIHCHSKKKNSFLYGCNTAAENAPFSTWTQVRLLPRLLARRSQYISLPSCRFGIEACKVGTARVVVWKDFQVMNSFTLENSFYGYDHGPETRVYTQANYREIGSGLHETFNDYRQCIAQIQSEIVDQKGWLKPIKLKQITGTPAAEVIAKEMREKRKIQRRAEYIRKYHSRMAKERGNGVSIAPLPSHEAKAAQIKLRRQATMIAKSVSREENSLQTVESPKKSPKKEKRQDLTSRTIQPVPAQNNTSKTSLHGLATRDRQAITMKSDNIIDSLQPILEQEGSNFRKLSKAQQKKVEESLEMSIVVGGEDMDQEYQALPHSSKGKDQATQNRESSLMQPQSEVIPGRDSDHTLLGGESNPSTLRQSHLIARTLAKEAQMRGQFGKPIAVERAGRDSSNLVLIKQEQDAESQSLSDEDEFSDDHGEFDASIEADETAIKLNNWRQFFDQEELNRAYQQSIIGFGLNQAQLAEEEEKEHSREAKMFESEQNPVRTVDEQESYESEDDSDDDASVDNLKEEDLYQKVYLQKESAFEHAMRQTTRAQKNFIQEVKIMIKPKDQLQKIKNQLARQQRESMKVESSDKRDFWERATQAFQGHHFSLQAQDNMSFQDSPHFTPRSPHGASMQLTGKQIEVPKKEPHRAFKEAKQMSLNQKQLEAQRLQLVPQTIKVQEQEPLRETQYLPTQQLSDQIIPQSPFLLKPNQLGLEQVIQTKKLDLVEDQKRGPSQRKAVSKFHKQNPVKSLNLALPMSSNERQTQVESSTQKQSDTLEPQPTHAHRHLQGPLIDLRLSLPYQQAAMPVQFQRSHPIVSPRAPEDHNWSASSPETTDRLVTNAYEHSLQNNQRGPPDSSQIKSSTVILVRDSEEAKQTQEAMYLQQSMPNTHAKRQYLLQVQTKPQEQIGIKIEHIFMAGNNKGAKVVRDRPYVDGRPSISMQEFVLQTPGKEDRRHSGSNSKRSSRRDNELAHSNRRLIKGSRVLASRPHLNPITEAKESKLSNRKPSNPQNNFAPFGIGVDQRSIEPITTQNDTVKGLRRKSRPLAGQTQDYKNLPMSSPPIGITAKAIQKQGPQRNGDGNLISRKYQSFDKNQSGVGERALRTDTKQNAATNNSHRLQKQSIEVTASGETLKGGRLRNLIEVQMNFNQSQDRADFAASNQIKTPLKSNHEQRSSAHQLSSYTIHKSNEQTSVHFQTEKKLEREASRNDKEKASLASQYAISTVLRTQSNNSDEHETSSAEQHLGAPIALHQARLLQVQSRANVITSGQHQLQKQSSEALRDQSPSLVMRRPTVGTPSQVNSDLIYVHKNPGQSSNKFHQQQSETVQNGNQAIEVRVSTSSGLKQTTKAALGGTAKKQSLALGSDVHYSSSSTKILNSKLTAAAAGSRSNKSVSQSSKVRKSGQLVRQSFEQRKIRQHQQQQNRGMLFGQFIDGDQSEAAAMPLKTEVPATTKSDFYGASAANLTASTPNLHRESPVEGGPSAGQPSLKGGSRSGLRSRRGEDFQQYLAMNMHCVQSQSVKKQYEEAIEASQLRKQESDITSGMNEPADIKSSLSRLSREQQQTRAGEAKNNPAILVGPTIIDQGEARMLQRSCDQLGESSSTQGFAQYQITSKMQPRSTNVSKAEQPFATVKKYTHQLIAQPQNKRTFSPNKVMYTQSASLAQQIDRKAAQQNSSINYRAPQNSINESRTDQSHFHGTYQDSRQFFQHTKMPRHRTGAALASNVAGVGYIQTKQPMYLRDSTISFDQNSLPEIARSSLDPSMIQRHNLKLTTTVVGPTSIRQSASVIEKGNTIAAALEPVARMDPNQPVLQSMNNAGSVELGFLEDQQSLANINILKVANSGLSPIQHANSVKQSKVLKTKFTRDLPIKRGLGLVDSNHGHRLKLKSLFQNDGLLPTPNAQHPQTSLGANISNQLHLLAHNSNEDAYNYGQMSVQIPRSVEQISPALSPRIDPKDNRLPMLPSVVDSRGSMAHSPPIQSHKNKHKVIKVDGGQSNRKAGQVNSSQNMFSLKHQLRASNQVGEVTPSTSTKVSLKVQRHKR